MRLALVGYGKMGRAVEELAVVKGIDVVRRLTRNEPLRADRATRNALTDAVLVDFSVPDAVPDTVRAAALLSLNVVIGTTGWSDRLEEVREVVDGAGIGVVHASNFSVGVNVFYRLVDQAAKMLSSHDGYDPFILDWHHRFKRDSPSGTAIEIQKRMAQYYGEQQVPITCQRVGYVPSVHSVGFDSEADTLHMEHRARSRRGLAEGALLAATWIGDRRGFHDFGDVLDNLLQGHSGSQKGRQVRMNVDRSTTRR
jgi:4-hydroxy-tetrahydrodipicolinate reductase